MILFVASSASHFLADHHATDLRVPSSTINRDLGYVAILFIYSILQKQS